MLNTSLPHPSKLCRSPCCVDFLTRVFASRSLQLMDTSSKMNWKCRGLSNFGSRPFYIAARKISSRSLQLRCSISGRPGPLRLNELGVSCRTRRS
jgi:hypothetical protein